MNSAAYLLKYFLGEEATNDSETFNFADLSAAMVEVHEVLTFAAASGDKEAGSAAKCLANLWQKLVSSYNRSKPIAYTIPRGVVKLDNASEMALRIAKRLLGDKVNTVGAVCGGYFFN